MMNNIVVIKIGTNLLTTPNGQLDLNNLRSLTEQISFEAKQNGKRFVIISSGSITCGSELMKIQPNTIPEKQAAASVGQILLMNQYATFFGHHDLSIGQILLTKDGIDHGKDNIRNTIFTLLSNNIIPIINENDSVATDEIQFGDNDHLSSLVANLIKATLFIMLTDIDGLFTKNPKEYSSATLIQHSDEVSDDLLSLASGSINPRSKGGMQSKLLAAKFAVEHSIETVIANGRTPHILHDIIIGKPVGTRFVCKP